MALSYVLDTSAYSAFYQGDARLKPYFKSEFTLLIPLLVIGELRAGFAAGNQTAPNEANLQRFLDSPTVQIIAPTLKTSELFAKIYATLGRQGTPIGTSDMWIAASAIEQQAKLITLDADFQHIPDLALAKVI